MKIQRLAAALILSSLSLPSAHADQLKYIKLPDQALAAFTALANNSKRSIDLTTFIFEPCHASTQVMMEIFAKRSKAGVRVRLLLDEITQSAKEKKNLAAWAEMNGIELRWYHNPIIPNPGQNHRSHAKFMVIDGESYISGGRNIADEYFGMFAGPNFVDRDVMVKGSSAKQAAASFEEIWNAQLTGEPRGRSNFVPWAQSCGVDESKRVAAAKKFLGNAQNILKAIPQRTCGRVNFLMDAPDFLNMKYDGDRERGQFNDYMSEMRMRRKRVTKAMLTMIRGTRSSLDMENWVYMPEYTMHREIKNLRNRKVDINVITNEDMDGPGLIKHAEEYLNGRFARKDSVGTQSVIQISRFGSLNHNYALSPKGATYRLHGKVYVRDNSDTIVSSYNIDPRSYHTNIESAVVVEDCPAFAADAKSGMKDLVNVYVKDIKSGKLPAPRSKDLFARIFGFLGHNFF
jgi:putative cardiolipin synthase